MSVKVLVILLGILVSSTLTLSLTSFVVVPEEAPTRARRDTGDKPILYDLKYVTDVTNRLAVTVVRGKVKNSGIIAIPMVLPAGAFITEYTLEADKKAYKAAVKSREDAQKEYANATGNGRSAAIVESATVRDSNQFDIDINLLPGYQGVTFVLTYEQLLQRQNFQYEILTNLFPGVFVDHISVEINIVEDRNLFFVRSPPLRNGSENYNTPGDNPYAVISRPSKKSGKVSFDVDITKQTEIAQSFGKTVFGCQLVVQYDVERDCSGGDLYLRDNFFVHFFAPCDTTQFAKEIVFVLDTSGSMGGTKIQQLKDAMLTILSELNTVDYFTIVTFNSTVNVYAEGELIDVNTATHVADEASQTYIAKGKQVVNSIEAEYFTNIMGALTDALTVVKRFQNVQNVTGFQQPLIIFLTDGLPAPGETNTTKIIENVDKLNNLAPKIPIFCLSFGDDADQDFLTKLCSRNNGFHRHIYVGGDASQLLVGFYDEISTLTLTNLKFNYPNVKEVTKSSFPLFFDGYELMISGKGNQQLRSALLPTVTVETPNGALVLEPTIRQADKSIKRHWAHLSLRQILEARSNAENKTKHDQAALNIALNYGIVAEVSALVLSDPSGLQVVDAVNVSKAGRSIGYSVEDDDLVYHEFIDDDMADSGSVTISFIHSLSFVTSLLILSHFI